MNNRSTLVVAVTSLALGFLAGSLPNNSVGSPQLKDGQVKSVDLMNEGVTSTDVKNGTLKAADLAPGTLPTQTTLAYTRNILGGCGAGGWCYLTNAGSGTTVASFDTSPPNSSGWTSTGTIELATPAAVLLTATPTVWSFGTSNLDSICSIKDGPTTLVGEDWIRADGNQSHTHTISGVANLAAGTHAVTLVCRASTANAAAVTHASMSALIVPTP